jgi:hypothetical protein
MMTETVYYGGWLLNDFEGTIQECVLHWCMRDAGCTTIQVREDSEARVEARNWLVQLTNVMFHKAHYNILAAQIRGTLESHLERQYEFSNDKHSEEYREALTASGAIIQVAIALARRLKIDNTRFDPAAFLDACSHDNERWPISELWEDIHEEH